MGHHDITCSMGSTGFDGPGALVVAFLVTSTGGS